LALTLPGDADALAALPDPDSSVLKRTSEKGLKEALDHFGDLWQQLVSTEPWTLSTDKPNAEQWIRREGGFWSVLRVVGTYHGYCLARYAQIAGTRAAESAIDIKVEKPEVPDDGSVDELVAGIERLAAATALLTQSACWWAMLTATRLDQRGFMPGELPESHDADLVALQALDFMEGWNERKVGELLDLHVALCGYALRYRTQIVRERAARRQKIMQESLAPTSHRELNLLSMRSSLMVEKYGEKQVERVFEQQLTLIFQSFGFTVVPARPGEAGADLLCISREGKFSFLVDAKSSRAAYRLPKSDQRALKDYADEFESGLSDLPRLEFVLIVGQSAAGTVSAKLKELEARVGVPIRFAGADLIAAIRQQLSGPVVPRSFRDLMIKGDHILDSRIAGDLKLATDGLLSTYSEFINGLRKISGQ
jgi:hypothetical protein